MSLRSPHPCIWTWPCSRFGTLGYQVCRQQYSTHSANANANASIFSPQFQDLPSFFYRKHPIQDKNPTPLPTVPSPTIILSSLPPKPEAKPIKHKPVPLPRTPDKSLYGKWRFILEDNDRVRFELSGVSSDGGILMIDHPDWCDDVALWACLLDVSLRWNRRKGATKVLKLFLARQPDIALDGQLADFFWDSMTSVALDCDQDFHQLVRVANKVVQVRNAAWPRLYATSVRFFFENKRYADAVECHKMLAPMFDPGPLVFADIITRFVINHDTECQAALKSIYSYSNYRDLYDKIIPLLHRRGKEVAARDWRAFFLQYHDRPRSMASSPFIRFLNRYFPNEGLCEEEMMVLHPPSTSRNSVPVSPGRGTTANSADYACNKPPPNDRLIARWFASEWSSIGFSFTVIQKLGVKRIGSFSLQSLGLRCNSCLELLSWVKELKGLGITVTQSNYSSVVLRAARSKNDRQLLDILQSDVHPDVFEDIPTLQKILTASAAIEDWSKHRLFTIILAHLKEDATPRLYRHALMRCFKSPHRWAAAFRLLQNDTCNSTRIRLSVFNTFMNTLIDDSQRKSSAGFRAYSGVAASICLDAMERGYAVPSKIWAIILSSLARTGQLREIESISGQLVFHYTKLQQGGKVIRVHSSDAIFRRQEQLKQYRRTAFPASTSFSNKYHPLRLIFNERVVIDILSSGFRSPLGRPEAAHADKMSVFSSQPPPPSAFGPAAGLRLLRVLHEYGVPIQKSFVQSAITYAVLDWKPKPWKIEYSLLLTKHWRAYSLPDIKVMCDKAWGSEVIPPIANFREAVTEARTNVVESKRARDEEYKRIARRFYKR